jgi:hypothetical protein
VWCCDRNKDVIGDFRPGHRDSVWCPGCESCSVATGTKMYCEEYGRELSCILLDVCHVGWITWCCTAICDRMNNVVLINAMVYLSK